MERSTVPEIQAAVQQFNYAGTGETILQGDKMRGSSGSTGWFVLLVCVLQFLSSSRSSVGVMQVEDSRRVTKLRGK